MTACVGKGAPNRALAHELDEVSSGAERRPILLGVERDRRRPADAIGGVADRNPGLLLVRVDGAPVDIDACPLDGLRLAVDAHAVALRAQSLALADGGGNEQEEIVHGDDDAALALWI